MSRRPLSLLLCSLALACSADPAPGDAGAVDASLADVSAVDVSSADVPPADTSAADTQTEDAPDTTAPDTTAPDTTAPDTLEPDTTAPDTTAPDTTAPDTTAPDTLEPDTTAPDTTAPDTAQPACGDGAWTSGSGSPPEQCDDGNTQDGDGCSATCQLETEATATCAARHQALLKGVTSLDSGGGLPGQFVVHGPDACAHVLDKAGRVIVATTRVGQGRLVALGHNSFIGAPLAKPGNLAFALNAIAWLGGKQPTVGLVGSQSQLAKALKGAGITTQQVSVTSPGQVDVLVSVAQASWKPAEIQALKAFAQQGGGLLLGGQAWWWGSQNSGAEVTQGFAPNTLSTPAGLTWSTETATQGVTPTSATPPPPWTNAWVGLQLATLHAAGQTALPLATRVALVVHAGLAVRVLPLGSAFFAQAAKLSQALGPLVPTESKPIVQAKQPLAVLGLRVDEKRHLSLPAAQITAHPAAADFPGAVPADAPTVTAKLSIDGDHAGLHKHFGYANAKAPARRTTGLYAAPGAKLTVTLGAGYVGKGLRLLIGAHSDKLWKKDKIERHPNLVRAWPLDKATTQVASAFGGPVYVQVPVGAKLGDVPVSITGAVAAPRYELGVTSAAAWKTSRDAPGPWAELVGQHVAFTMPSSHVRKLDDPAAVLKLWDQVLEQSAILAAIPVQRPRRERICADRQISAGYMHSGYPIMTHLDSPAGLLDVAKVKSKGSWGLFHEIGHNHQWRPSVLAKTTEVTVNLWSVHSCETLTTNTVGCHPNTTALKAQKLVSDWVAKGAKLADWTPWNALQLYLQLRAAFGWAAYKKVWQAYYALPESQQPKTDPARADTWCVLMSQATGKRLGWFLKHWATGVSEAGCLDVVAKLPPWLDDPMRAWFPYPAELQALPADKIGGGKAEARLSIADPGGKGATLTLFYGPKDGGEKAGAWAKSVSVGAPQAGVVSVPLSGLSAGQTVVVRARISNALGAFWTPKAQSFLAK